MSAIQNEGRRSLAVLPVGTARLRRPRRVQRRNAGRDDAVGVTHSAR